MKELDDLYKASLRKQGIDWDQQVNRIPTTETLIARSTKQFGSAFPLRLIGHSSDESPFYIAEEERHHMHVLGLPGEGKSKFIEMMACEDIRRGYGLCLLDSGDFGSTFMKVLRFCRKIGFEKVCIIDPNDFYALNRIPSINIFGPLKQVDGQTRYRRLKPVIAGNVAETLRILWESDDTVTSRINRYVRLLVQVLYNAQGTLADFEYFKNRENPLYKTKREAILERSSPNSEARASLEEIFYRWPVTTFNVEFASTIRRFDPIFEKPLPFIVGSTKNPVPFSKLVTNGWVILCNLDPQIWSRAQQKFLGTLILNEVIHARYEVVKRAGEGVLPPYYIYIDEVGRYATETLSDLINYRRKSNIRLIMAHQQWDQLKNSQVAAAIKSARVKVLFHTERDDRDRMVDMMYGGKLSSDDVSYALSGLQKQHAIIKIDKTSPVKVRLIDTFDVEPNKKLDRAFREKLYQQPWYNTREDVTQELHERFPSAQPPLRRGGQPTVAPPEEQPTFRKSALGATSGGTTKAQSTRAGKTRKVRDDSAGGEPDVLSAKRRSTRKVTGRSTKAK